MGYFRRTVEENYQAAVAAAMEHQVGLMIDSALGHAQPLRPLSTSLGRIAFLRGIAEYVREYKPSWVVDKWVRVMDKRIIRKDTRQRLWFLVEHEGLDIHNVIEAAQTQCDRLLVDVGSDKYLPFEAGRPEFRDVRMHAVATVNPRWREDAYDSLFSRIAAQAFGV